MSTKKKVLLGAAFVATLFVGVGIGANGSAEPVAAPTPAVTKTYTPAPLAPVTKEVASEECIDALDDAEKVSELSAQAFNITSDILMAASQFDVDGMEAGNDKLDALKPKMDVAVAEYNASSSACRTQQ